MGKRFLQRRHWAFVLLLGIGLLVLIHLIPDVRVLSDAPKEPEIIYFTADSDTVKPGGRVSLRWKFVNAPSAKITTPEGITNYNLGVGLYKEDVRDILIDFVPVPDNRIASFILVLVDSDGVTPLKRADGTFYTRTVNVRIDTNITINAFSATPSIAERGQTIRVSWNITGATDVTLDILEGKWPGPDSGKTYPPVGSVAITLSPYRYYDVVFRLVPKNASERGLMRSLTVPIRCPYTYFFLHSGEVMRLDTPEMGGIDPRQTCPLTASQQIRVSFQRFEKGIVLWRSDLQEGYALVNDSARSILILQDSLDALTNPDLQTKLGAVVAPAQNYDMTVQEAAIEPYQETLSHQFVFYRLPDSRVVMLRLVNYPHFSGRGELWAYVVP